MNDRPEAYLTDTAIQPANATAAGPNGRRTSVVLRDFVAAHLGLRVSIGDLRDALGDRAFGILLVAFALPNLLLISVPGVSSLLGIPLILLSWQLARGRQTPWFPRWIAQRSFAHEDFARVVDNGVPYLERVERLLRPRLAAVLSRNGDRLLGAFCLLLSVVIALPIPFGNWPPALAVCIIGLTLVERDGVAALLGIVAGIVSLVVAGGSVVALFSAFLYFLRASAF
jgi:hypothetical protein